MLSARTEGSFARIDHYHDAANDHWRVSSKDGLVSLYGTPRLGQAVPAIIHKPKLKVADRDQVFAWKPTLTKDSFGNRIEYEYERDTREEGAHHWDQPYLRQIRYADYVENRDTKFLVR